MTTNETASAVTGRGAEVKDTVTEQGSQVAGTAKSEAQNVAGTAKDQAQQVVGEATQQARDLAGELRTQVQEQTSVQRDRLVSTLQDIGEELRQMADGSDRSGLASELARQAADRVQGLTGYVQNSQGGDLLEDVRNYARRRPGTFLLGAAVAGVLAGRLTRGAKAASSSGSSGGSAQAYAGGTTGGYSGYTAPGYAPGAAYTGGTTGETYPGETYTGATSPGTSGEYSRHIDPSADPLYTEGPRHAAGTEAGYSTTATGAIYDTDPVYTAEGETVVPSTGGRGTDPREPQ